MAVLAAVAGSVWPFVLAGLLSAASVQQPRTASEQDVKAAFLYNFTQFVTWPAGVPRDAEPFRFCVVADPVMTRAIEATMAGETVNGHPAETRVPREPEEVSACQLLFIDRTAAERAKALLEAARDRAILTVGESDGFAQSDGIIQFVLQSGRVSFDINPRSAERVGLNLSSRLLRVARKLVGNEAP